MKYPVEVHIRYMHRAQFPIRNTTLFSLSGVASVIANISQKCRVIVNAEYLILIELACTQKRQSCKVPFWFTSNILAENTEI